MARYCNLCRRTFLTERGFADHNINVHRFPKPPVPPSTYVYHPHLDGVFNTSLYAVRVLT